MHGSGVEQSVISHPVYSSLPGIEIEICRRLALCLSSGQQIMDLLNGLESFLHISDMNITSYTFTGCLPAKGQLQWNTPAVQI